MAGKQAPEWERRLACWHTLSQPNPPRNPAHPVPADRGAVVVSWSSGEPKLEVNGTTARSGPPAPNPGRGIVQYGPRPDGLKKFARGGPPSRYTQTYPDLRYTSGWWSHVLVDSLIPNERVYYRVGNDRDGWSQVSSFIAPPAAGTPTYPLKFTVIADVGQTYNTSVIVSRMEEAQPRAMLVLGDMAYADTYRTDGTPRLKTDPKKDYQPSYPPRWDTWGRLMAPLMSRVPVMAIPGNHEVEKDLNGAQFESYKMRRDDWEGAVGVTVSGLAAAGRTVTGLL